MSAIILSQWDNKANQKGEFIFSPKGDTTRDMEPISEIRRKRLRLLIEKHGGLTAFVKKTGLNISESNISRITSKLPRHDRPGSPLYNLGDRTARQIEAALGLTEGWMDAPLTYAEMTGQEDPRQGLLKIMEQIPENQWDTARRLLAALIPPSSSNNQPPQPR